jgi:hypothetical protein
VRRLGPMAELTAGDTGDGADGFFAVSGGGIPGGGGPGGGGSTVIP